MYPGQPLVRLKQNHNPHNLLVNFNGEGLLIYMLELLTIFIFIVIHTIFIPIFMTLLLYAPFSMVGRNIILASHLSYHLKTSISILNLIMISEI